MQTFNFSAELARLAGLKDYPGIVKLCQTVQRQIPMTETRDHKGLWVNMAMAYAHAMDYPRADKCYREALFLADDPSTRYQLAIMQLHNGEVVDGFANYGGRWAHPESAPHMENMRSQGIPYLAHWDDLAGKRLFVSGEQGLGDEIMFSRVLQPASQLAAVVYKLTPAPLQTFMAHHLPVVTAGAPKMSGMAPGHIGANFDAIVAIGDLFALYVAKHGQLPPLVLCDAAMPVYQPALGRKQIGFVHSPGVLGNASEERKINPRMLRRFSGKYDFYSLQVGAPAELGVDLAPGIRDFMDTANLVAGLDCVVTCDTAIAHLALTLGKPTLVLYESYVDWRWKVGLYPHVELLSMQDHDFDRKFHDFVQDCHE